MTRAAQTDAGTVLVAEYRERKISLHQVVTWHGATISVRVNYLMKRQGHFETCAVSYLFGPSEIHLIDRVVLLTNDNKSQNRHDELGFFLTWEIGHQATLRR